MTLISSCESIPCWVKATGITLVGFADLMARSVEIQPSFVVLLRLWRAGTSIMKLNGKSRVKTRAFTLIELLVVVAIIALLMAILLPALERAREQGKRAVCLNNVHTLTVAWTMYCDDFDGILPKAYTDTEGWIQDIPGFYRNPEEAPEALQLEALRGGTLFPYLRTTKIFRCPVAPELRTYSITHAMNGFQSDGGTIVRQLMEIRHPAHRIVVLDDFIRDWDACWMVCWSQPKWWNTTPIRHGYGNVFSFADGHSEYWKWQDQRTIDLAIKCYGANSPKARFYPESVQEDNPDLMRVTRAVWGSIGY